MDTNYLKIIGNRGVYKWLTLLGYWIHNGNYENEKVCIITGNTKKKEREIIELVKELGYGYTFNGTILTIYDNELYEYLKSFKELPEWVWKLDKYMCKSLLEGIIYENIFATAYEQLADQVIRLCSYVGWSCNKSRHTDVNYDFWQIEVVKE